MEGEAMRGSSRRKPFNSLPKRKEGCFYRYLKPGALAKIRDSKITARSLRHASRSQISLSELLHLATPTAPSPSTEQSSPHPPNQENGLPCFASRINYSRPRCLQRKKLFAVTPFFTETEQL